MSKSKDNVLLLMLATMLTGFLIGGVSQPLQTAHSQTDYEEYIIMEDINEQKINQQNIGSGSSNNINCGANTAGTNLPQPITCIAGDPQTPGITAKPVVTQRSVVVQVNPSGITSGRAECNSDEVVTGGGYKLTEIVRSGGGGGGGIIQTGIKTFKEFAADNSWYVEMSGMQPRSLKVYAECLKLVPA
jgi:hypothetical protein